MNRFARTTISGAAPKAALLCVLALFALLAARPGPPALAQDTLRAAAVVNDEVISMLDLIMRTRLVVLASGLDSSPDTEERMRSQVLRSLIDERLQVR